MNEKNVIVFHIGTHKTGTTALQNFLTVNKKKFIERGWYYPTEEDDNLSIVSGEQNLYFGNARCLYFEKTREAIFDEIVKYTEHYNVILSYEGIWEFSDERLKKFFSTILERYSNIKILVYLRRQDEYIESLYNQNVKGLRGYSKSLSEYSKEPDLLSRFFDYLKKLELLEKLVGNKLIVRRYVKDTISDFLSVIGVELDDVETPPFDKINLSLGSALLEIKRIMNGASQTLLQYATQIKSINLNNIAAGHMDYYKTMSPEMRKNILKKYEADNEEIVRRYIRDGKPLFENMNVDIPYKEYRATPLEEEMIRVFFTLIRNLEKQMKNMALNLIGSKKKLAYFGAGNVCHRCLKSGLYRPDIVIDTEGGREIDGIPVINFNEIKNWKDYYVIITTGSFQRENFLILEENGLKETQDYVYYGDIDWNKK